MKFGRNLPRNQVPEWASAYINYKGLKKLIKAAAETAKAGKNVDIAEFLFALDRNLEDVDSFYNKKFAEVHRRLKLLQDRYGRNLDVVAELDDHESEELMSALLELRNQLRNLQWFGEINRRGFVKITKKLGKKVPQTATTKDQYITTVVDPKPFAKDTTVVRLINEINRWLSILGDAQNFDDARSDRSSRSVRSLGRMTSKALPSVPQAVLDSLDTAIRQDDAGILQTSLSEHQFTASTPASQTMLLNLLQRSISSRSKACIAYILPLLESLHEPDDLNERNCIHRLVIYIGRTKSSSVASDLEPNATSLPVHPHYNSHYVTPAQVPNTQANSVDRGAETLPLLGKDDESVQLLCYVLESLQLNQRSALSARDSQGRIPLHYAAQYGFVILCEILMSKMQEWGQFNVENGIDAPVWQDKEGNAPLHLAVVGGHPLTTKCLLRGENWRGSDHVHRKPVSQSGAVLAMATRSNFISIVRMLVEAGVDINWQDGTGETALHVAARFGHTECARTLIEGSSEQKANLQLTEKSFSWNALHISAVDGHLPVAELLVNAGIDVSTPDSFGWTAKEHAGLRGHMDVAKFLAPYTTTLPLTDPKNNALGDSESSSISTSPPPEFSSLEDRRSDGSTRITDPVKSFGHRYLKDECLVMVSLGSMDMRRDVEPVKLDRVPLAEAHTNQLDTALSVVISAQGAHGEPTIIDLPVHDNISTEPILFYTSNAAEVKMLFDIVPTYSGNEKNKIGRAVALLSSVRPNIGTGRMNLQGDVCVPIMGSNLEVIGAVNFNFLVITPFTHPNMEINSQQTYWKKLASTMLIGHRGLGKNFLGNKSLQLGENTVSSFIAAANLGAQYVEFDVQLTKDHVPVIYHDFLVSETGIDAPVHTLTLEQFLHINDGANSRVPRDLHERQQPGANGAQKGESGSKQRSLSVDFTNKIKEDRSLDERMKYTLNYKKTGYKANTRGNFVQAPFATLEELFKKIPEDVGFNIEMKYPMLLESEQHYMDTYAIELNSFCDTVLAKVYELAPRGGKGLGRHIIFSSFNPDICLCLSFKQPSIPILFLTDSGVDEVSDIRASSLQEAIRFASRWNLLGIVSNATPFVVCPRLVKVVKQSGLVCVSYGSQNNDPEMVNIQVNEGIDAVIVDSVLAIRQELTKES
ncbi:Glycerophosphoryl diester phosphodiesterase family-domain-containing protein [Nemania sp. NC0429]|nr:Glycerophosphoryl diester phosphodiesterase family-domain-containing protein [Nemania sp. NC0429]